MNKDKSQKANLASLLILKKDNKVLLMKRKDGPFEGLYTFPSGKVDDGESFTDAIIRETKEEINLDLKKEFLKVVYIIHQYDKEDEWVHTFFTVDFWEGEIKNMETHRCDSLDWFSIDNLPENILEPLVNVINKIDRGEFYSELSFPLPYKK